MRILFNHGLTTEELYTNTSKEIIDKKWRWFIKYYGSTSSYEDAISDPFKYCFGLILNRVIDERVRFVMPRGKAYIDFEICDGDNFEVAKQRGRFAEIDFIESDFTGYLLRYYYKGAGYERSYPVYVGGDLKKKFISGINSGIKYYTTKNITVKDFVDIVHEKFNELTKSEIKKLLAQGFKRLDSAIRVGCAITINTKKFMNCYVHIGNISLVPEVRMKDYYIKRDRKLRMIEKWKRLPFDGYYYVGINPTKFPEWIEMNKTSRSLTKFKNVIIKKIQEEWYYKYNNVHIFRIKVKKFKGWNFWANEIICRNIIYMGEANKGIFSPASKTWKELIKEYEKG